MIPIYINNRDRLTTTRAMVERLVQIPDTVVCIIDNDSSYAPLLGWYEQAPCKVVRLRHNAGPRGAWQGILDHTALGIEFYVVTDSDLDLSDVPLDVLDVLREGFRRHPWAVKSGLSLRIDDIPAAYQFHSHVTHHEQQFWQRKLDDRFFQADIDTTFAMYRVTPAWNGDYGPSLRAVPPYCARHVPWYITLERYAADSEEQYYLEHCNPQGTGWTAAALGALRS